jgi:hypothetical protein
MALNHVPFPVLLIKNIGNVKIHITEVGYDIKMVADDSVGTARYYSTKNITGWVDLATSWSDMYWTQGNTDPSTRIQGSYMLHLEGTPLQTPLQTSVYPLEKPTFVKTANGRIISMYGSYLGTPSTRKYPVYYVKNVGGVNIYVYETFPRLPLVSRIIMVADNAVGTAKYVNVFRFVTDNTLTAGRDVRLRTWNDTYWTSGINAGVRSDGHYMIDKDEL